MTRRKRYSAEFKREALRRANEPGVTDVLVAEEPGINARMLRYWRDAAKRDGVIGEHLKRVKNRPLK